MRIALDVSPVSKNSTSAHKVRGVGAYIRMLSDNLQKIDSQNEYVFVSDNNFPKDVDLIHYPYFDPFFLTLPASFKTKTAVTVHDLTPIVFKQHFPAGVKGNIRWLLQKRRLRNADVVITDSNASKKDVENVVGIQSDRVKTVYLAAEEQFKVLKKGGWENEVRDRYRLPKEFVLYVGDATWNKNIPNLVEAVKNIRLPLVMVGKVWDSKVSEVKSNPWNNDLKKVLEKIESNPKFIKLGFVPTEDLVKIYNLATIFVMPSIYEGFGLPVLEAMTCGCPVVTGGGGSLFEVGGDAVIYIDTKDPVDIQLKIEHLLNNPEVRRRTAQKGIKQAGEFSTKRSIENLVKVYESIV